MQWLSDEDDVDDGPSDIEVAQRAEFDSLGACLHSDSVQRSVLWYTSTQLVHAMDFWTTVCNAVSYDLWCWYRHCAR